MLHRRFDLLTFSISQCLKIYPNIFRFPISTKCIKEEKQDARLPRRYFLRSNLEVRFRTKWILQILIPNIVIPPCKFEKMFGETLYITKMGDATIRTKNKFGPKF